MTETFEVGQKVQNAVRGDGEITYGPFTNPFGQVRYIMRLESGREYYARPGDLSATPEPPKFAVGDKVTPRIGTPGSIVAGPFASRGMNSEFWVVEGEDGKHNTHGTEYLTKVDEDIKVGDRVRVTDDDGGGGNRFVGLIGTVKAINPHRDLPYLVEFGDGLGHHGALNGRWNCKAVERADVDADTHYGVTYDLAAKYRDRDGDVWRLQRINGVARARLEGDRENPTVESNSLSKVIESWGPLTRI